jgi:hypothetical protein
MLQRVTSKKLSRTIPTSAQSSISPAPASENPNRSCAEGASPGLWHPPNWEGRFHTGKPVHRDAE